MMPESDDHVQRLLIKVLIPRLFSFKCPKLSKSLDRLELKTRCVPQRMGERQPLLLRIPSQPVPSDRYHILFVEALGISLGVQTWCSMRAHLLSKWIRGAVQLLIFILAKRSSSNVLHLITYSPLVPLSLRSNSSTQLALMISVEVDTNGT